MKNDLIQVTSIDQLTAGQLISFDHIITKKKLGGVLSNTEFFLKDIEECFFWKLEYVSADPVMVISRADGKLTRNNHMIWTAEKTHTTLMIENSAIYLVEQDISEPIIIKTRFNYIR